MGILDYFKPVSAWTTEQVRQFIRENEDGSYTLLDVRQPAEYEKGHLPGAVLIPVGELDGRVAELDRDKPTIVYCAAGVRSRAAATVLSKAGFSSVYSMSGGINAWSGLVAEGWPEAGTTWFTAAHSVEELAALAWVLEDGSSLFYRALAKSVDDREGQSVFSHLAGAEDKHKEMVSALFPQAELSTLLGGYPQEKVMEGGMRVDDALAKAKGKRLAEILDLSIALETSSYDRYKSLQRRVALKESVELFASLAAEEKRHLQMLTDLFERRL